MTRLQQHLCLWLPGADASLLLTAPLSCELTQYSMVTAFVFRYSLRASCPVGVADTAAVKVDAGHCNQTQNAPLT